MAAMTGAATIMAAAPAAMAAMTGAATIMAAGQAMAATTVAVATTVAATTVPSWDGTKVEIDGDKIEVTFADGTKQEIENGRFEQKNAAGRTVVERPATRADVERLQRAAAAPGVSMERATARSDGSKVEVSGRNIEVTHADGWREEIENGRYEMKDPNNDTVVERATTSADRSRLEGLAD